MEWKKNLIVAGCSFHLLLPKEWVARYCPTKKVIIFDEKNRLVITPTISAPNEEKPSP